ncbi:MAG: potassium channel protein [Armatimonadetes bacterium]|nr:potassium channel protein [Armatimonadota bacterium]
MTPNPLNRLYRIALFVGLMLCAGVLGYRLFSQLSWLDALYMTVTTLATVGYREVGDMDTDSKIFTILLLTVGAGVLVYAVTAATEVLLDEQTRYYFQMRSIARRAKVMKHHFIVCGLGRVGFAVCEELAASEASFIIIEEDAVKVQYASSRGWLGVQGDATDDRVLEQAGIHRAKGLITCIDTDAANLFVVISAKGLCPDLDVSARVSDENNLAKFRRAGASHAYSPFSLLGRRMARSVTRPRVVELLDLALEQNDYALTIDECQVHGESKLVGTSLKDSNFRGRYGAVILSIIREDRSIIHNPPPETELRPGDILVTLGTPVQLQQIKQVLT